MFACPVRKRETGSVKRFFLKVAAVCVIICGIEIQSASAATDTDPLFVPAGEAIMKGALAARIAFAFLIVSAVGLIVIKYSVRVPMRLFFTGAALLIYVLAFKVLGKSIHSLQVAGVIDTHTAPAVPFIDVMGLYPTLETMLPQVILLIIIVILALWFKKQESAA